jgi:hypothetical protein
MNRNFLVHKHAFETPERLPSCSNSVIDFILGRIAQAEGSPKQSKGGICVYNIHREAILDMCAATSSPLDVVRLHLALCWM